MKSLSIAKQLNPPEWLDGVALETWETTAPLLYQAGYFEETDKHCLAVFCETWGEWLRLQQQPDTDMDLLLELSDTLLKYSDALGLNPASRLQIQRNLDIVNTL